MSGAALKVLSSMATRAVLADLARGAAAAGMPAEVESIGGVDAARRIAAGEACDVVVLAEDAVAALEAAGHVVAGTRVVVATSHLVAAVRGDAPVPDLSTDESARAALLAAEAIGYSTGPSGNHLMRVFARWDLRDAIADRLVQAPPGTPVATLLREGRVGLGFQQASEFAGVPGIQVIDALAPSLLLATRFCGAVCRTCSQPDPARAWLAFASDRCYR